MLVQNFTTRHVPPLHWRHTWGPGTPGCLTDHHGTLSWLYAMKTTFELIQILKKSENSRCRQRRWWSEAVVKRPYKMWNKVPYCLLLAEKLLSLHGPSNWINFDQLLVVNSASTQLSFQSSPVPVHGLVHVLDTDCSTDEWHSKKYH